MPEEQHSPLGPIYTAGDINLGRRSYALEPEGSAGDLRTLQNAGVPAAVAVAIADDARVDKGAAADCPDGIPVVMTQVVMPCTQAQSARQEKREEGISEHHHGLQQRWHEYGSRGYKVTLRQQTGWE